jgi:hypothetical protein
VSSSSTSTACALPMDGGGRPHCWTAAGSEESTH